MFDLVIQDVLLGDGWTAHLDLLSKTPRSKLSFARLIKIPGASLNPKKDPIDYHNDADRRSQAIEHDDMRKIDGQRSENKNLEILILSKGEALNKRVEAEKNSMIILDSITFKNGHDISEL